MVQYTALYGRAGCTGPQNQIIGTYPWIMWKQNTQYTFRIQIKKKQAFLQNQNFKGKLGVFLFECPQPSKYRYSIFTVIIVFVGSPALAK